MTVCTVHFSQEGLWIILGVKAGLRPIEMFQMQDVNDSTDARS